MNVMNDSLINSNQLLRAINERLNFKSLTNDNGLIQLTLDGLMGQGTIEQITFNNKLSATNFNIHLYEDLEIKIPKDNNDNLYFFYNLEGICYHSFDNTEKFSKIDELKTIAVASSKNGYNILIIKKGVQFNCNLLTISREVYIKNFECKLKPVDAKLNRLNSIFDALKDHLFDCNYDLKITEQLRLIKSLSFSETISPRLQMQSRYQLILSYHIEQLYNETYNERAHSSITRSEIQKIRTITEYIIDNPGLNHSQNKLCTQFFISQSKLQHGFKSVHKTTVSNFTRKVRLGKAEELIRNSDLNISEVVYTVGFTSRSYFSKIFKQKYGCNPTVYKSQFKYKLEVE